MVVCGKCGRILKNKESIERGYGSGCYRKYINVKPNYKTLEDFNLWQNND